LVRWRGVIRSLIPVVVLFFALPALVIYVTFFWFGFTTDSLLVVFILFQCYIITLQVEIGLRQTAVSETEYEPALRPRVSFTAFDGLSSAGVSLENVGEYPAYNVTVGCIDKTKNKPVEDRIQKQPKTLTKGEGFPVFSMNPSEYRSMHIQLNVLYVNVLQKMGEIHFVKFPQAEEFVMISPLQRHGILLRYLDDLKLAYAAIKWSRILGDKPKM